MLTLLYTLLAVFLGATVAIYLSMNTAIAKYFGKTERKASDVYRSSPSTDCVLLPILLQGWT